MKINKSFALPMFNIIRIRFMQKYVFAKGNPSWKFHLNQFSHFRVIREQTYGNNITLKEGFVNIKTGTDTIKY